MEVTISSSHPNTERATWYNESQYKRVEEQELIKILGYEI
ncbi:14488_t:CDS:1 [Gigaspora rosea]|nr:14488_t:CDS:1 [Gigaspora rosea]